MRKIFIGAVCCLLVAGFVSCGKNKRFEIEPDSEKVEFKIIRFDQDLIKLDTVNLNQGVKALYSKYPEFMGVYISEILGQNPADTVEIAKMLRGFLSDTVFQSVNSKAFETFKDVAVVEQDIKDSYAYIHHYFPEIKLPELYFFVSGFNRPIMLTDKFIGIGVDLYLGSDYPRYLDFTYKYLTYTMRPEGIAPDVISALLFKSFPYNSKEERLLDNMIYRGKVMYLLSVVMPNQKPHDLMGYTNNQWEWSRKYEKEIWNTILDQNDLFSTDVSKIRKYLNDAPFTTPVSQDSPGRLGTWIGWQIVQSYMDNNKDVSLELLMKESNYQKILDKSGYRP